MKRIIVLDTETCGGMSAPLVYDLGYTIAENGAEIKTRSYTIKETFNNKPLFETAYYKEKRPLYEERLESNYSKLIALKYALIQLKKDIKKYGVDEIYAYNSSFDNRALKSTIEKFNLNIELQQITDIMNYIDGITENDNYKNFCETNGFMTRHKKPRPQKKAETLFRYLTQNPSYTEEHTALEDSKIELFILNKALGLAE